MRVLIPNSQDQWNDVDWAAFNFINHVSSEIDPYDLPSAYYDNVQQRALDIYHVSLTIVWVSIDTWLQEPAGWDLDITEQELTVFVLKWR